MDIDLAYIEEVDPEFALQFRAAIDFKKSEYGRAIAGEIDALENSSEKSTVTFLCEGEVDAAKTSAALAAACEIVRGILWENAFIQAEILTSQKGEIDA